MAHYRLGGLLVYKRKDYRSAVKSYRAATKADSRYAITPYSLGYMYYIALLVQKSYG